MMFSTIHDELTVLPRITAAPSAWDGKDLSDENIYAALAWRSEVGLGAWDRRRDRHTDEL